MQYGIHIPPFGPLSDARALADLAADAEAAGWDGFFLWDDVSFDPPIPVADPWIALAAMALRTQTIRLGPLVTPLPRRRPWKVAREALTLDHLSGGRLILGVGTGGAVEEFASLGEAQDPKLRAAMLDEGLHILTGLWRGEPFQFAGAHYHIEAAQFLPRPVQTPRIPIWVAAAWPNHAPLRRAARWDGVFPLDPRLSGSAMMAAADVRAMRDYIAPYRDSAAPFAMVHSGRTPGDDAAAAQGIVAPYAEAGVTWWLEDCVPHRWGGDWQTWPLDAMRARVRQGAPHG
jgi:alkanesulfonate monooxygenase SsuD/methylene tetrahydromethanopterin reductase-like flavin-dependent oxidoreductase (luciferase family)